MTYLIASILLSVGLLINFRLFPKFGIDTFQAIVFNYVICFITGYFLMPSNESFSLDFSQNYTWYCLLLGFGFISTFILSGISTQKAGITITSLANNISLIIPVLFSLFVFNSTENSFSFINYVGLILGIVTIGLTTYKKDKNTHFTKSGGGIALAVFLLYGISNTAINYIQIHIIKGQGGGAIPVMLIMVLGAIVTGFLVFAFRLMQGKEKFHFKNLAAAVTLGVPNFLSFYFLIQTLNFYGSNGAFVYPLYNLGVILVSAFVAFVFFKEKLSKLNLVGLFLAVVAIILLSWNALFV